MTNLLSRLRIAAAFALILSVAFAVACNRSASSTLTTYKSLVAARSTIQGFSTVNPTLVAKYKPAINSAVDASNTADAAFVLFVNAGAGGDPSQLSSNVEALTSSVISIVADLTSEFNTSKADEIRLKYQAHRNALAASGKKISLVDILSYLQIAAAAAQTFIGSTPAGPGLAVAQILLTLAKSGIAAYQAAHTIDLSVFATPLPHI